uniref:Uncharacterized protein n=1 Tax=Rhizophora mucronata TaxID=61149 RepID=A0A2P2J3N9_RHIMU
MRATAFSSERDKRRYYEHQSDVNNRNIKSKIALVETASIRKMVI